MASDRVGSHFRGPEKPTDDVGSRFGELEKAADGVGRCSGGPKMASDDVGRHFGEPGIAPDHIGPAWPMSEMPAHRVRHGIAGTVESEHGGPGKPMIMSCFAEGGSVTRSP